jgi:hypothetical protein
MRRREFITLLGTSVALPVAMQKRERFPAAQITHPHP